MAEIDRASLIAHLKRKANHPELLIHAVMTGLITAIQRGDFDQEGEPDEDPQHQT